MNTAAEVNISLVGWLNSGMEKAEVVVRLFEAMRRAVAFIILQIVDHPDDFQRLVKFRDSVADDFRKPARAYSVADFLNQRHRRGKQKRRAFKFKVMGEFPRFLDVFIG